MITVHAMLSMCVVVVRAQTSNLLFRFLRMVAVEVHC